MPRPETKTLVREEGVQDAKRVFVIATEDSKTGTCAYFEAFGQNNYFNKFIFRVEVIPSVGGNSAPEHILENVRKRRDELIKVEDFDIEGADEFWIACDTDSWGRDKIMAVIALCDEQAVKYAFSNPCSEVWFLFHQKKYSGPVFKSSKECKTSANKFVEKKGGLDKLITKQNIRYAINIGEAGHRPKKLRYPTSQGSHLYKVLRLLT